VAFGVFAGVLVHGVMAGTDASHPLVVGLYVATAATVSGLIAMRIAGATASAPAPAEPQAAKGRGDRAAMLAAARETAAQRTAAQRTAAEG